MNKIYGNRFVLETIEAMIDSGGFPTALLFTAKQVSGKKL